jgi:hypothetical protein
MTDKYDIPYTLSSEVQPHHCSRENKSEEITVIPSSHTVIEPYAMVIAVFYATVTDSAMGRPRGSPKTTRGAIFCGYVSWGIEVLVF